MSAQTPKNSRNIIILSAIGLIALGAIGYLGYRNYQLEKETDDFEYQIDDLNTEIIDLETDLQDMQAEISNQDLELEEKDQLLAAKEQELLDAQKKINTLLRNNKINKEQAEALNGKVEQLDYYIKKYQKEVEELKVQVASLENENLDLRGNIENIKEEKFSVEQENLKQRTKLEAAAIHSAYDIRTYRVKTNGKAIEDEDIRRGALKTLRVCFKLLENIVAEKGTKDIYILLNDPEGNPLLDMTSGQSGFFTFQDEETEYTFKTTTEFTGATQEVCADFQRPENRDIEKGEYEIVVFTDGIDIGRGSFIVK